MATMRDNGNPVPAMRYSRATGRDVSAGSSSDVCGSHDFSTVANDVASQMETEKKSLNYSDGKGACVICFSETMLVVCLPCGHVATCAPCTASLFSCCICREEIHHFAFTYISV